MNTTIVCIILCQAASGSLVSIDSGYGSESITRDSRTGLDWLDPPLTAGWNYVDLLEAFRHGGEYAGFRYANQEQVRDLFEVSAGAPRYIQEGPGSADAAYPLLELLGLIKPGETHLWNTYLVAGGPTPEAIEIQWFEVSPTIYLAAWEAIDSNQWSAEVQYSHTRDGHYLIRDTLPGDADRNGVVDFVDFLALSDRFGQWGSWSDGDFTHDGQVDFSDFLILSDNFGSTVSQQAYSIPEPGGFAIAITLIALCLDKRKRNGFTDSTDGEPGCVTAIMAISFLLVTAGTAIAIFAIALEIVL